MIIYYYYHYYYYYYYYFGIKFYEKSVNQVDIEGNTAIHYAAHNGLTECVGINPNNIVIYHFLIV